jgi:hypothetical protein
VGSPSVPADVADGAQPAAGQLRCAAEGAVRGLLGV